MFATPSDLLHRRARRDGGGPLLTQYRGGDRTELSVASFANWVDKTANLLDSLGVDADSDVALPVLAEHPDHWMALVWPFACWQRGVGVRVAGRPDAAGADLAVIGPDAPAAVGADTLACSLHPWGLPLTGLPAAVADYSSAALAEPDAHAAEPADPGAPAWTDAHGVRTFAELDPEPSAERVGLVGADAWRATAALIAAIAGGGSLVVLDAADAGVLAAEKARLLPGS